MGVLSSSVNPEVSSSSTHMYSKTKTTHDPAKPAFMEVPCNILVQSPLFDHDRHPNPGKPAEDVPEEVKAEAGGDGCMVALELLPPPSPRCPCVVQNCRCWFFVVEMGAAHWVADPQKNPNAQTIASTGHDTSRGLQGKDYVLQAGV